MDYFLCDLYHLLINDVVFAIKPYLEVEMDAHLFYLTIDL